MAELYSGIQSRPQSAAVLCVGSANVNLYKSLLDNPLAVYEVSGTRSRCNYRTFTLKSLAFGEWDKKCANKQFILFQFSVSVHSFYIFVVPGDILVVASGQSRPINASYNWFWSKFEHTIFERVLDRRDRYDLVLVVSHPYLLSDTNVETSVIEHGEDGRGRFFLYLVYFFRHLHIRNNPKTITHWHNRSPLRPREQASFPRPAGQLHHRWWSERRNQPTRWSLHRHKVSDSGWDFSKFLFLHSSYDFISIIMLFLIP